MRKRRFFQGLLPVQALLCAAWVLAAQGCDQDRSAAAKADPAAEPAGKTAGAVAPPPAGTESQVVRIVFVGQKDCCDCTRARIEASWKALQQALGDGSLVTVERLDWDVDELQARRYEPLGRLVTIPGLYFLDARGGLVKLLQGEVSAEQIKQVL